MDSIIIVTYTDGLSERDEFGACNASLVGSTLSLP